MSCLSASVSLMNEPLPIDVRRMGNTKIDIELLNEPISVELRKIGGIVADAIRIGNGISASVSIVCSLKEFVEMLKVSPQEIQWITDDVGVYYEVESNVKWIVEISN